MSEAAKRLADAILEQRRKDEAVWLAAEKYRNEQWDLMRAERTADLRAAQP